MNHAPDRTGPEGPSPADLSPARARALFRGGLRVPTSGYSPGYAQANLISLPRDLAFDFLLFAQRNPKACPVLDVTEPGEVSASVFDGDLRTDLPAYRVYRGGELVEERPDVTDLWRDDLVSFLIGCSFTFETPLLEAGVPVRHIETGGNVAMYRTNRECRPAGSREQAGRQQHRAAELGHHGGVGVAALEPARVEAHGARLVDGDAHPQVAEPFEQRGHVADARDVVDDDLPPHEQAGREDGQGLVLVAGRRDRAPQGMAALHQESIAGHGRVSIADHHNRLDFLTG